MSIPRECRKIFSCLRHHRTSNWNVLIHGDMSWILTVTAKHCILSLQNSYVEDLTLIGWHLEAGLWEVIRFRWCQEGGTPMMGTVPLLEKTPESLFLLSLCRGRTQWEGSSRELLAEPDGAGPWSQTSRLCICEEISFCCLSHSVNSIFLMAAQARLIQWVMVKWGFLSRNSLYC